MHHRSRTVLRNALSIDVEEWFHAELIRPLVSPRLGAVPPGPERRAAWALAPILRLLRRYDVQATFFMVGDVLRHQPNLVHQFREEGHEIGCHGNSHRPLWSMDRACFQEEMDAFDREAAALMPVDDIVGYRAPTFSLDERSAWAIDVLAERGYRYDSSIFPMKTGLYGVDDCPASPYRISSSDLTIDRADGRLIEFPMTVLRSAGFRVPVCGGFYLRATPIPVLVRLLSRVNDQGHPFVIYLHPWEADQGTPRIKGLSPTKRFVTYHNTDRTLRKLESLLKAFSFGPLREVLAIKGGRLAASDVALSPAESGGCRV